jgi:isopentenyl diphosphate isomerase/L-lactate dehydrogenase-like FMN-dependent dehydrogenase
LSQKLYSVGEAQRLAKKKLPKMIYDFVEGSAGDESLRDLNTAALDKMRLMPRVLIDVSKRSLDLQFLGKDFGLPFGVAPMGMCNLVWPLADQIIAREAARRRFPVAVSTASSTTLEKMIELAEGFAWFQLYADQSPEFVSDLIERAASANYDCLILTVDVPIPSRRLRDLRNGFSYPFHWTMKKLWQFTKYPRWSTRMILTSLRNGMPEPANYSSSKHGIEFDRNAPRTGANWEFLKQLRDKWSRKLVVKGVLCPDDAILIKNLGIDAIYVSNHGGRQLNAAPTVIDSLISIREAVGKNYPLIFDGGIRNGEHVVKAMANGANFTMLGRSVMYALGASGKVGMECVIESIGKECDSTIGLLGCCSPSEVGSHSLAQHFSRKA